MKIVELDRSYAARYRALMLHAYAAEPTAFTSTAAEREQKPLSWWEARLGAQPEQAVTFGAVDDQTLLGAVTLEFSDRERTRHKAHLIGMYVLPQGRNAGNGRGLVQACVITSMTLTVTDSNVAAIALYEALGFLRFGLEPRAVRNEGTYLAKVHMALSL